MNLLAKQSKNALFLHKMLEFAMQVLCALCFSFVIAQVFYLIIILVYTKETK
jgi:hypothetical protein